MIIETLIFCITLVIICCFLLKIAMVWTAQKEYEQALKNADRQAEITQLQLKEYQDEISTLESDLDIFKEQHGHIVRNIAEQVNSAASDLLEFRAHADPERISSAAVTLGNLIQNLNPDEQIDT